MISKEFLRNLQESIKIYDEKNGKDYLIAYGGGKKTPLQFCELTFKHENFWHLLGCKVDKVNGKRAEDIYNECKDGLDVTKDISLVHSYSEANIKKLIFDRLFDFVANAKMIKLGYVGNCPEGYYLTMALGSESGIVGYGDSKKNVRFLFPKSVQDKKLSTISKGQYKILFILSKPQNQKVYSHVEYEIKKDVMKDYLEELMKEVCVKID